MTIPRYSREQILEGVREDIADCLAVDLDEVQPETNFRLDLGGESIDVLDLAFRSEKRFGVRSPFSRLTDPQRWRVDETGRPTAETVAWLRAEFPTVTWENHLSHPTLKHPMDLFTISLFAELLFDAQFQSAHPTP